jgi:hypothetical protein
MQMNNEAVRAQATLAGVSEFATAEAAFFPPASVGGQLFAVISSALAQVDTHVSAQVGGGNTAREGTEQKALAQEELLDLMMMIRRTSRSMDHEHPGLHAKFRIPPNLSATELLGVAEHFATEAAPFKTDFIAYGLPETFLEDLDEQIADVREALDDQTAGTRTRVTATAGIRETLDTGFTALRRVDPVVQNVFRDQPAKLAAWSSARHLERAPRRKRGGGGSEGGTPPAG